MNLYLCSGISENTPVVRSDVRREDDEILSPEEEIARLKSGNTTQIKEYWSTQNDSKGSSRNRFLKLCMKIESLQFLLIFLNSFTKSHLKVPHQLWKAVTILPLEKTSLAMNVI